MRRVIKAELPPDSDQPHTGTAYQEPTATVTDSEVTSVPDEAPHIAEAEPEVDTDDWRARLTKLCGGDQGTMESVCEAIVIEVPDLVRRLNRAAKSGDQKALKTAAHTLKSCLRYVAQENEINLAREVETNTDDSDWVARLKAGWTSTGGEPSPEAKLVTELQALAKEWVQRIKA